MCSSPAGLLLSLPLTFKT